MKLFCLKFSQCTLTKLFSPDGFIRSEHPRLQMYMCVITRLNTFPRQVSFLVAIPPVRCKPMVISLIARSVLMLVEVPIWAFLARERRSHYHSTSQVPSAGLHCSNWWGNDCHHVECSCDYFQSVILRKTFFTPNTSYHFAHCCMINNNKEKSVILLIYLLPSCTFYK